MDSLVEVDQLPEISVASGHDFNLRSPHQFASVVTTLPNSIPPTLFLFSTAAPLGMSISANCTRPQLTTTESLDSRQHSHGNQVLGAYPCRERVPPPSLFWDGGSSSSLPDVHSRVVSFFPRGMWYDWKGGRYISLL